MKMSPGRARPLRSEMRSWKGRRGRRSNRWNGSRCEPSRRAERRVGMTTSPAGSILGARSARACFVAARPNPPTCCQFVTGRSRQVASASCHAGASPTGYKPAARCGPALRDQTHRLGFIGGSTWCDTASPLPCRRNARRRQRIARSSRPRSGLALAPSRSRC